MNKPYFIGIGAQKSATSWVFKMLQEHPGISVAEEKEVHFFSNEENFSKGIEWYESKFQEGKVSGEISTSYLSSGKSAERIKEIYPNIKIIVGLRNPIDRTISHIEHIKSKGKNLPDNLEGIIKEYPEVIENSLYGKYLENYFNLFQKENILVFFFDEVKNNPSNLIKGIYTFLGVDNEFKPKRLGDRYNSGSIRKTKVHKFLNSVYFSLNGNFLGRFILKISRLLGIRSHKIVGILDSKVDSQESDYSRKDLSGYFKEDIEKLENILNKDLSSWKND